MNNLLRARNARRKYSRILRPLVYPEIKAPKAVKQKQTHAGLRYLLLLPLLLLTVSTLFFIPMLIIHRNEWIFWVGMALCVIFFIVLWRNSFRFLGSKAYIGTLPVRLTGAFLTTFIGPLTFTYFLLSLQSLQDHLLDEHVFFLALVGFSLTVILYSVSIVGREYYRVTFVFPILFIAAAIVLYQVMHVKAQPAALFQSCRSLFDDFVVSYIF
jgi:hypothetical protein